MDENNLTGLSRSNENVKESIDLVNENFKRVKEEREVRDILIRAGIMKPDGSYADEVSEIGDLSYVEYDEQPEIIETSNDLTFKEKAKVAFKKAMVILSIAALVTTSVMYIKFMSDYNTKRMNVFNSYNKYLELSGEERGQESFDKFLNNTYQTNIDEQLQMYDSYDSIRGGR